MPTSDTVAHAKGGGCGGNHTRSSIETLRRLRERGLHRILRLTLVATHHRAGVLLAPNCHLLDKKLLIPRSPTRVEFDLGHTGEEFGPNESLLV